MSVLIKVVQTAMRKATVVLGLGAPVCALAVAHRLPYSILFLGVRWNTGLYELDTPLM